MIKQMVLTLAACLSFSGLCMAANPPAAGSEAAAAPADAAEKTAAVVPPVKADRFLTILEDPEYKYYLDMQSARWIQRPRSDKEQILDVWIKLVEAADKQYSYPETYLLEHYYIRPATRQIQFLCELEVAGRPSNTVEQRLYDESHWEELIPGSVEEKIYQAVIENSKKIPKNSEKKGLLSVSGDFIEETLRISI